MPTNNKMPTIVGILTFMSRINFKLNWVGHGKSLKPRGLILCIDIKSKSNQTKRKNMMLEDKEIVG